MNSVIPREQARDLRTIKNKLDRDEYRDAGSYEAFQADLQLMLDNARKFNPPGTFVHEMADKCAFAPLLAVQYTFQSDPLCDSPKGS